MIKALLISVVMAFATPALAVSKCYIEKNPNVQVTMWTNVQSNNPLVEGYMYAETPFIGECATKINGFCLALDNKGKVYSFFKENQVKVIPSKQCL